MQRTIAIIAAAEGVVIVVLIVLLASQGGDGREDGLHPGETGDAREPQAGTDPAGAEERGTTRLEGTGTEPSQTVKTVPFAEKDAQAWSAQDPVGILLYGSILDSERKPVAGGYVRLTDEEGVNASGRVEKAGVYLVSGLRPGTWNLSCKMRGYRPIEKEIVLAASPTRVRMDILLERAVVLTVKLKTPDGTPLEQALKARQLGWHVQVIAVATREHPEGDLPMTSSRGHSRFGIGEYKGGRGFARLNDPAPPAVAGTLELKTSLPVHVSAVVRHAVIETQLVPVGAEEVVFVIPLEKVLTRLCTVSARLVDSGTGAPIEGAKVEISDRQSSGGGKKVGEDGVYHQANLRPGIMEFVVHAKGYERIHHYIRLVPGQTLDFGTVRMAPGQTLKGRVVDENGERIACSVSVHNLERMTFPQDTDIGRSTLVDHEGNFTCQALGFGRHLVTARATDHASTTREIIIGAGEEQNVQLVLKRGTLVILETTVTPQERLLFETRDEKGTLVHVRHVWGSWKLRRRYLPGRYTLKVYDGPELRKTILFTVGTEKMTIRAP